MIDAATLTERYAATLRDYLAGGGESALHDAHELGREAFEAGLGPLVLFSIHRDAVDRLPAQELSQDEPLDDPTTVFVETLAPFQMAQARLDDAQRAGRELASLMGRYANEVDAFAGSIDGAEPAGVAGEQLRSLIQRHLADLTDVRTRLESAQETARARGYQVGDIVRAQEDERRRIATEIHDDAVQVMTAVSLRLGLLGGRLSTADRTAVEQLEGNVREAINRLRNMIGDLRPPELDHSGLAAAVRSSLEQLESGQEIACRLTDALGREPSLEAQTVAFRIVQEALTNIRKHARARRVDVVLKSVDGGVAARVTDDGVGFDVTAATRNPERGHLGLAAMRERAEMTGGWLTIESRQGRTCVEAWVPDAPPPVGATR